MAMLSIDGLTVRYGPGSVPAVADVSLDIAEGEVFGLVGESGSGKTTLAMSIGRLLPGTARYETGRITLGPDEVLSAGPERLRKIRATALAYVFQNPITSLDPTMRIGRQLALTLGGDRDAVHRALEQVRITDTKSVARRFPHQLSGGMAQRVGVALAIARRPGLLIVDEPTSALDPSLTAEILDLLIDQRNALGTSILMLSHDLGSIARRADRVGVMQKGRLVEQGPTAQVFSNPRHEYTRQLLGSSGNAGRSRPIAEHTVQEPVASLKDVTVAFATPASGKPNLALRDVSLEIGRGEVLALVGESGSGKTTLARLLLGFVRPTAGAVNVNGLPAHLVPPGTVAAVLQNPDWALNPRLRVAASVSEPLRPIAGIGKQERRDRTRRAVEAVGLDPSVLTRFPGELSGGQRQRVSIARALIAEPSFLVLDEPLSALDALVQHQVMEVLRLSQQRNRYAALFITHDLAATQRFANRIGVLYAGALVEVAPSASFHAEPVHPYSRLLTDASHGRAVRLTKLGDLPSSGCRFAPRCRLATDRCRTEEPILSPLGDRHVACFRAEDSLVAA